MSISPLDPPPPLEPPQANATKVAVMRTASPLARTIWFPLVFVGRPVNLKDHTASPHSPPSSQLIRVGARVRRRRMRPHGMAEPLLRSELWTRRSLQVKPEIAGRRCTPPDVGATWYQYGSAAL